MKGIAELFRAQAASTPSSAALYFDDEVVTYEALNARANQLARLLRSSGVGPEGVVGVCMRQSADLVVALLAIVKAGAAYVGLDTAWPAARIAEALEDSAAAAVIVDADSEALVASGNNRAPRVIVSSSAGESIDEVATPTTPAHLMSIVYTSGSTGKPKGVMVTLRSVVNRLEWMWSAYPFHPADATLLYRSCAAVGFTWDCFGALLKGVPTSIRSSVDARNPAGIVAASRERGVTHLTASAGLWEAILDEIDRRPGGWPSLRVARTTGEPLRPETLERWRRALPNATLLNIYGATECSGSVAYDATARDTHTAGVRGVCVGAPVPNVDVFVMGHDMRVLGPGEEGDVCIGGAPLARGYLGRPGLTAERFVPSPASTARGERLFRTGDVGFWRADGQLVLVGRRDLQVKIRGFRVELEEVEAALRRCPGVAAAAVHVERADGDTRLVAFLVSTPAGLSSRELRADLTDRLPAYMVPTSFAVVDELPRTATGKIDRRALAGLQGRALESSAPSIAPSTPSEVALVSIWQEVLGIADVGLEDDFFEIGGHSMSGIKILSRVYDRFGVELPFSVFFEAQTVKALASQIDLALQPQ